MSSQLIGFVLAFVYLLGMLWVGIQTSKWIRSGDDFLLSGRELGWFVLAGGTAAMQLAGTTVAGYPGTAYFKGWGAVWGAWGWVFSALVFLFLFSRFSRRTGAFTTVEWFEAKFGSVNRLVLAVGTCIALLFGGMAQFVGASNIVVGWTGMSYTTAVLIIGISTVLYMYFGGFWATMITDTLQFVLAGLVLYIGIPIFLFTRFGGFGFLTSGANPVPPELLSFPLGTMQWGGTFLFGGTVIGFLMLNFAFMLSNSYYWNKSVAARSDRESFKGWLIASLFVIPFGIVTVMIGLYARAAFPGVTVGDQVFGLMLAEMHPILSALMMVGILAATQSTADAVMLGISTILTRDIVPRIAPKADMLYVGKWFTAIIGAIVIAIALWFKQGALYGLALMATFVGPALPPLAFSVLWPRFVSKEGSATGMFAGIVIGIYWQFLSNPPLWKTTAHTMFVTFFVSLVVMIVVSIITKFTGPWWTSQQEINRKQYQQAAGGAPAAVNSMSFEYIFCELSKPIFKFKPFIRYVETLAKQKNPNYVSILTEKN